MTHPRQLRHERTYRHEPQPHVRFRRTHLELSVLSVSSNQRYMRIFRSRCVVKHVNVCFSLFRIVSAAQLCLCQCDLVHVI